MLPLNAKDKDSSCFTISNTVTLFACFMRTKTHGTRGAERSQEVTPESSQCMWLWFLSVSLSTYKSHKKNVCQMCVTLFQVAGIKQTKINKGKEFKRKSLVRPHVWVSWGDFSTWPKGIWLCEWHAFSLASMRQHRAITSKEDLVGVFQASAFLPAVGIRKTFGKQWTLVPPLKQYTKRWGLSWSAQSHPQVLWEDRIQHTAFQAASSKWAPGCPGELQMEISLWKYKGHGTT